MNAVLSEAVRPAVAGYVEALTATAALGWVWTPGQAEPLPVELHLGAEVVAKAIADGPREDLLRSGIGEGRHAFSLAVPEALRARLAELRVVACTPDGAVVPLGNPPVEDGLNERLAQLTRGMEVLVGSQRVLHRIVQAALLAPAQSGPASLAEIAVTQAALQESTATLELFVVRLEQAMVGLTLQPSSGPASPRWALGGIAAVSAAALVASIWALVRIMPG